MDQQFECAPSVILIDDEEDVLHSCRQTLELEGMSVQAFNDAEAALEVLSADWNGVVLSDVKMPGMDGMELLARVQALDAELPVILITGHGDVPMALKAVRDGAYDFIEKPAAPEHLVDVVRRAREKRSLVMENRALRRELASVSGIDRRIIGNAPSVRTLRKTITEIADIDVDVLVYGETGTGKELVARCLHDFGKRRDGAFVALNCGALPETIIESELFGHEAGAFTGAVGQRIGKLEYANAGTLFLDEIESMPRALQVKLLRVLQERSIERLGGNKTIPIDVRVIAATKIDLHHAASEGHFRQDLYYRLNVVGISIPPLRERPEDIPILFAYFAARAAEKFGRPLVDARPSRLDGLAAQPWPGNVRELAHVAERHVLGLDTETADPDLGHDTLSARVEAYEKQVIEEALIRNGGVIGLSAAELGIPRKKLYLRMQKYAITRNRFVPG